MQADNRWVAPYTVTQTEGTEGDPQISAPIFLDPHATQDNVDASGNRIIVISGASGAGAYVQFCITSNINPEDGSGGAWVTLMNYDQGTMENGVATFGGNTFDSAMSLTLPGPVRAIRLASWGGTVRMEVAS